ncbi:hypothetical protein DL764_010298 [Monosporascus ibericus]|uniref:DUF4267 domain-containing protein n=1 Tax=Monosporascus ibericus TaxID=155417 RepID=A0A4Q4SSX0_9PEZI|nr:hypothetical protein DL764_010298 [Monosporascus ibericus]
MPSLLSVTDIAARTLGCVLVWSNCWWITGPVEAAKTFGIPDVTTPREAQLGLGIGGRNAAAGLAVLALSLTGQRRAVGTLFACWTLVGFTDIGICLMPGNNNVSYHFPGTIACVTMALAHLLV